MRSLNKSLCFAIFLYFSYALPLSAEAPLRKIEAYPSIIEQRLRQRQKLLESLLTGDGNAQAKLVIIKQARRWAPGDTLNVAFEAGYGSQELRTKIEAAAKLWTKHANINLQFRDSKTNEFREFTTDDDKFHDEIRISFRTDDDWSGYWSLIGIDSIDSGIISSGVPSMNLGGIENESPVDLVGTVLHEFGHALGAEHEHQHPGQGCNDSFRWDDDPGYISTTDSNGGLVGDYYNRQPGIYTYMSGAPDYWGRAKVDYNLRQLTDQNAYESGGFDKFSIMKYYFPPKFFWRGKASPCYAPFPTTLSEGDKKQIAQFYPKIDKHRTFVRQRSEMLRILKNLGRKYPSAKFIESWIKLHDRRKR